jgi:IS30 family transposase
MGRVLTQEQVRTARRLRAQGWTLADIGRQVGTTHATVLYVCRGDGRTRPPHEWQPRAGRLTVTDREEIFLGLRRGMSFAQIARELDPPRPTSTVSREVNNNGGREGYSIWKAHRRAQEQAKRTTTPRLVEGPLLDVVTAKLEGLWSPQMISNRLRQDFPHDPDMWVSHETIYQSLFVQGRGELRRELARCLRSGRTSRRPHGSKSTTRGKIAGMVMLSERPAEADDRAVPGHWEGDLVMGKDGKSAIGTLVERSTRFALLLHLEGDHTAQTVQLAMQKAIATMPAALLRSIAWDQGSEMSQHAAFTIKTGIPIYFCDPHSPWQRGSNENFNGLLRQYFPKGTDLSTVTPDELQAVQDSLNGRPRATLGYRTPAEELTRLVALTN